MTNRTQDWTHQLLNEGDKWFASRRVTGVADESSSELIVENTGENAVFIEKVVYRNNNGEAFVDATRSLNIDSSGTEVNVVNMNVTDNTPSQGFDVEYGGSYSGGTTFSLDLITGSSGGGNNGRSAAEGNTALFRIGPDENIRFTVTNKSDGPSDQFIEVIAFTGDEI